MNAISRLLPRLIIERLRDCYETLIMENQFGFRQNRSTTDAIFIIREAIKSTKKPLYLCMIDLRAAYEHVDIETCCFLFLTFVLKHLKLHLY